MAVWRVVVCGQVLCGDARCHCALHDGLQPLQMGVHRGLERHSPLLRGPGGAERHPGRDRAHAGAVCGRAMGAGAERRRRREEAAALGLLGYILQRARLTASNAVVRTNVAPQEMFGTEGSRMLFKAASSDREAHEVRVQLRSSKPSARVEVVCDPRLQSRGNRAHKEGHRAAAADR